MKLNELSDSTNVIGIKIKLPAKALKMFKAFAGGESEMYVCGSSMGCFFMSPDSPEKPKRRLYPLPPDISTTDILQWKVASQRKVI